MVTTDEIIFARGSDSSNRDIKIAPEIGGNKSQGTRRCYDVESTSLTLIQCRNNVVCTLGIS